MSRRWLLLILVACLPLAACGGDDENGNNGDTPRPTTNNYAIEDGSLLDPNTVSIGRVETTEPSWVVVFEDTTLLGHTRVDMGESSDVEVPMDIALSSGSHTLEAILFRDGGALELFEVPGNDQPILENGELVSTVFEVTVDDEFEPGLTVSDQTADTSEAGSVNIDQVTARNDAWVVVRTGPCESVPEDAGEIRGTRQVGRGEESDVVVDVTPEVSDGDTLCAYLHDDDPRDGQFGYEDGGDEDLPINIEGSYISGEFDVTVEGGAGDPLVEASDQNVSGDAPNEVTIDRVVAADAGWIVVRRDSCTEDGEVVGHASVADGENTDVAVTFDQDEWILGPEATFCATLHEDDPADDTFTYDGSNGEDVPVLTEDDNEIFASLTVTVDEAQTPELTVSDQLLETTEVLIDSVYVVDGIWLALYTDDGSGARDTVIGSSQISPTPTSDVAVDIEPTLLGRALDDGETLHVAVHTDDPNDETFDPENADPVSTDTQGAEFTTTFAVQVPNVDVSDQTVSSATTFSVSGVRAATDGWIAVYDEACPASGAPWGSRLGFAAVTEGESSDVDVTLDSALVDQQTVCVVLHTDSDADDSFDNIDPASDPDPAETRPTGGVVQADAAVTLP